MMESVSILISMTKIRVHVIHDPAKGNLSVVSTERRTFEGPSPSVPTALHHSDNGANVALAAGLGMAAAGSAVGAIGVAIQQSYVAKMSSAVSSALRGANTYPTPRPFSFAGSSSAAQAQENARDQYTVMQLRGLNGRFNHVVAQLHSVANAVGTLTPHIRGNVEELVGGALVVAGLAVAAVSSMIRHSHEPHVLPANNASAAKTVTKETTIAISTTGTDATNRQQDTGATT
jgi:hypothetical protein